MSLLHCFRYYSKHNALYLSVHRSESSLGGPSLCALGSKGVYFVGPSLLMVHS